MEYRLLDLAPLAIFAFGALTFSTLALSYWSERRRAKRGSPVFFVFTLACAAAFLSSLLYQLIGGHSGNEAVSIGAILLRDLAAGLLPPLMLHLVFEVSSSGLPGLRAWRGLLAAIYAAGIVVALADGLDETGLATIPWSGGPVGPSALLAATSAAGLALMATTRRQSRKGERAYRRWIGVLLFLMLVCAAATLLNASSILAQAPDYLLLAFLTVSLYYRERLVFFDVLVKRGVFLAVGLAVLAGMLLAGEHLGSDEMLPVAALGVTLLWLMGPWVYAGVAAAIDHVWLRKPFSPAEAERQFIGDIQAAADEGDLRSRAAASLSNIFQTSAAADFSGNDGLVPENPDDFRSGPILLKARPSGIPYLSDDRRLAETLAGNLGVVLENVRFRVDRRQQEEREQQLRLLASRAELKALRAQINPHFLFNTLSVIAGLLHSQPERAEETIEQLAQVFRYALRKSESEWTHLADEIEFVTAYLHIEKARFGERLKFEIDVEPVAAQCLIPAMCIQPLVENAIKHGVSRVPGPGRVAVRAAVSGEFLTVEVRNSGPGFPSGFSLDEPAEGHGLRNVWERLRAYYGNAARLSWENHAGESNEKGTRLELTIPTPEASAAVTAKDTIDHARVDR